MNYLLYPHTRRWLIAIMSILIMTSYDAHAKGFYVYSVIRIKGNRSRWKGIAQKPFFIA